MGVDCDLLGFVMGRYVGVVVAWCVGVFVVVHSTVFAVSSGPPGSGDALYGLDLRVFLYVHMRTPGCMCFLLFYCLALYRCFCRYPLAQLGVLYVCVVCVEGYRSSPSQRSLWFSLGDLGTSCWVRRLGHP